MTPSISSILSRPAPSPTEEQTSIVRACLASSSNLIINALAGTGKTATLEMIEQTTTAKPILYLVFNKKNADEATKKMQSTTTVRTLNAFGHRIWAKTCSGNITLDGKKTQNLLSEIIKELPKGPYKQEAWDVYWEAIAGVNLAKALGYVPERYFPNARRLCTQTELATRLDEEPSDTCLDLIDEVLVASIKAAYRGLLDFNDQVYLSALFGGTYPQHPLVLVDELQDLSPVNHAMLDKLKKSRIIGVGDPWQSIYGFRGAKRQGMADAKARFEMSEFDLSVSFRCPRAVVEAARWRVPKFKWIKEGGHVETLQDLPSGNIPETATFLCRNNAPLFRVAFRLLSSGRSVQVAGSDIGPKLTGILKKLGDADWPKAKTLAAIDQWLAERLAKESKSAQDMADCMRVFASHGATLGQAIAYAEHLFSQKGKIKMMTIHKSKGLEFPVVFHLDPWLCRDDEQDLNLRYVAITRSSDRYYEIDLERIKW
jgi:DNA helicase-2/ATP-dependent DNA helicase PcrA